MRSVFTAALMASGAVIVPFEGGAAFAQESQPVAPADQFSGVIARIVIEGNVRIDERTILNYLLVAPGEPFSEERLNVSLKTLFATGQFADVDISRRGNDLIVRVVENPIINRVIFEGNKALKDDKIREEIQAEPRGTFTNARVRADVQRILQLYRQSGRFAAQVTPQFKPLDQGRVDLIFEIIEGPVTGVRSINFIGNEIYTDRRLRGVIATKQSRLWRFFSSNDNYDPDRLAFDREQLRTFYQNEGYYDFRVTSAIADLTPDQEDFYITFTIEEGQKYNFGDIKVETALDKLDGNRLRGAVRIQDGDLYQADRIEDAIDSLTFAAGFAGYAFVDIRPRIEPNPDTGTIDVTFVVDEGPRVYIERINIVGNTTTLDRVIRRELAISEGDAFNRVLLDRSRNNLRRLGFFSDVEISERPSQIPDRTIVDVAVTEQPTGELSFSAGFSSVNAFLFDVSVSQRNLRGRGQRAVATIRASTRQQLLNFQFTEPAFLDRNLSAGIDIFANRTDFSDVGGFESETYGGSVRFGFPLTERIQLGLSYQLRQDNLEIPDADIVIAADGSLATTDDGVPVPVGSEMGDQMVVDICDPLFVNRSTVCLSERSELSSIIGYDLFWNRRGGDPINPTRGFDLSLSQDLSGLGGDVQLLRSEGALTFYRGILPGVTASLRLAGGYVFPFGDDDSLRINNRFFRGGQDFRGFNVFGIGPRVVDEELTVDENGELVFDADGNVIPTGRVFRLQSLGGQAFYQGTLEVTLPQYWPDSYGIRTALFVEAGGLGLLPEEDRVVGAAGELETIFQRVPNTGVLTTVRRSVRDEAALRSAAGLSIFWRSPFGPIRFDISQTITATEFDRPRGFRFSTTTQF